jgi:aspartate 1-decarboxylase
MRCFLAAKIHDLRVTEKVLLYEGSVAIDAGLMQAAGIAPYEQVHVINTNTGNRWVTYALPAGQGVFSLNGGGARLGEIGDRCIVLTYRFQQFHSDAQVIYCDEDNRIAKRLTY